jgi:hypothetical protein
LASGGKFGNGAVSAAFTHLFNSEANKFYQKLNQNQRARILSQIRGEIEDELAHTKALINQSDKFEVKLQLDHKRLARLLNKYGASSILAQGVSIAKTAAGRIPNAVGLGVGVLNRVSNLSEFTVTGFIYRSPFDGQFHAGFNAFDANGNGYVFGNIDGF